MVARVLRSLAALLLGVSVVTCGGGGDSSGPDTPGTGGGGITISLAPNSLSIVQAASATTTVTVARPGSTPPSVALSTSVGTGITATFDPPTLSGGRVTSTLTIALSSSIGVGTFPLYVVATPTSGDTTSAVAQLTVTVTARPSVTVTKAGSGAGTVTSNPAGINCGGVCTASFDAGVAVTLTATPASGSAFASWAGQCAGTELTCTFTPRAGSTVTATFNATAPAFTLAVSPPTVTVQQGAAGAATIAVTRINGFASPITVTTSGVPTGVTATFSPASITDTQSTLTLGVAPSVPAANYPITVTGNGTGVAQKTATFNLVVTPSGGSGSIALNFADCDPTQRPIWFATQGGGGAWTRVNGTNNTFAFNVVGSMGVAYVTQNGTEYATVVQYLSAAELTALATGPGICGSTEQTGTKRATGTFANYGGTATSYWTLALGGVFARGDTASVGPGYTLTNIAAGPRDLIAARIGVNAPFTQVQTMIVRRATNYANNSFIPLLDIGINGPETFTPVQTFTTVTNRGGDSTIASVALVTKQGRSTDYYTTPPSPNDVNRYPALPSDRIQEGEYHLVSVFATAKPENPTSFRFTQLLLHAPANRTITLGPPINPATVTSLGAGAPLRLRAQLASQAAYNGAAEADYSQSDRSVSITSTAAYAGGLPATWSLDVPDLSSAGYDATWGLRAGQNVDWGVVALSADNLASFAGGALVDNAQLLGAASLGSTAASQARAMMHVGPARSIADLMRRVP